MIQTPMDVLRHYEIRKTKAQKTAFLDAVQPYIRSLGYTPRVETGKQGLRNLVIGDVDRARYLITAHYDTPASIGLPNLITPNNPVTYILVQLFLVGVLIGVSVGLAAVSYFATGHEKLAFATWYVVYFGLMALMLFGPANRHNANDNTSGVVTVLQIMQALPQEHRHKVCFVLFDLEERGLVGSAVFRKKHKAATEEMTVLNLDCVGDGDVIQLAPAKKARNVQPLLEQLDGICGAYGQKQLRLRSKGFTAGSSDHKNFPRGVGIMAFREKKGVGLYCGRIHTWRDTRLDEENVRLLTAVITQLVQQ